MRVTMSVFFWMLAWLSVALAVGFGFSAAYVQVSKTDPVAAFFMVGCALFLTLSGLFATLAARFQSERR